MKKLALFLSGVILVSQGTLANNTSIGFGYGVGNEIYKGHKTNSFAPILDLEYKNYFIKETGLNGVAFGYNLYEDDFYALSIYVKPVGGYKISSDDMDNGYKTIDSRKNKIMGGAEFKIYTGIYDTELSTSIDYGKKGGNIFTQLAKQYYLNSKTALIPSINFAYFSSNYVDYYFGVSEYELGGKLIKSYKGKAGYSFGLNLTGSYNFTDNFALLGFVGIDKFSDEFKNSPIVENNIIYNIGTGIIYTF